VALPHQNHTLRTLAAATSIVDNECMTLELTVFQGSAGDRNSRGWAGAAATGQELGRRLGTDAVVVGTPREPLGANWDVELAAAADGYRALAERYVSVFEAGAVPVTLINRCAVAIATLPIVARYHPDAVVLWFDGHADLNVPGGTTTGYLGGLAFSAALGLWDSGFGAGLAADQAILCGARDIDEPEQAVIDAGGVTAIPVEKLFDDLETAIAGRPVYVHIDCDVFEPGQVETEYSVPGGLTLDQFERLAHIIARSEVVGVELGEYEGSTPAALLNAVAPLLG